MMLLSLQCPVRKYVSILDIPPDRNFSLLGFRVGLSDVRFEWLAIL